MQAAEALSLAALVKATQALSSAKGYTDPQPLIEALAAAVQGQIDALGEAVEALQGKADADHAHPDLAELIEALRAADGRLELAVAGKAEAEHEHPEYAHTSKLRADFDHVAELLQELAEADDATREEFRARLLDLRDELSGAQEALRGSIAALADQAQADAQALSRRVDGKADAGHSHEEFSTLERDIAGLAQVGGMRHREVSEELQRIARAAEQARLVAEAKQERGPKGEPGERGKPGKPGADGQDAEPIKPMGDYIGGSHDALSLVRHKGAAWLSVTQTDEAPSDSSEAWMLLVKDGRRGEKGERGFAGRGRRGPAGADGQDGEGGGSSSLARRSVSTDTAITQDDDILIVTDTATVTLPDAASTTKFYYIKRVGDGDITLQPVSGQSIDGQSSLTLNVNLYAVDLFSDGSDWLVF